MPLFCCAQRQQLYKMLVKQRCLVEGRCDLRNRTPTSPRDKEELLLQGKEMENNNKFIMDLLSGLREQSEVKIYEDYSVQLPVAETFPPASKVLNFRLSRAPGKGCWTVCPWSDSEKELKIKAEEEQLLVLFCENKQLQFGICHYHQDAESLQKYYSNSRTFLTVLPDGSAQAFYPSGLLALVVVVTAENGRVCIVYDDSDASTPSMRAMFQSDGRATCYHSNGNIWLTINSAGGQCLNEAGTRVRRWSWNSQSLIPTPLHPVFLSLNKAVGVRIFGKEQVFVSFLAKGQQARFSVGSCCTQCECTTGSDASGPSTSKEELYVLEARARIHQAFQNLHQYMTTPSHPHLLKTT
ncbi:hypothetical protein PBY51_021462 [Eleginops maclovinus]|uniref:FAM194 C-terminal domain-containing protein n=1 Tax=Eleginops maclovinus TaxID=56733 RepID=A0AAN8AM24_ELEMC|nr:hypothetical protein PBY51_021462 [Eleginops maclovinus]